MLLVWELSGFCCNSYGIKTAFIIDALVFFTALIIFIKIDFVVKS